MTGSPSRVDRLPSRGLPVAYFGFAHLCLIVALTAVILDPRGVAGFFYHDRMLAIVHLITLGWISSSILGALYIVGPVALRTPLPPTRADRWAAALVIIGASGMVSHFWLSEFTGMAWSGGMVGAGFAVVAWRVVPPVLRAPIGSAVKVAIALAFLNILAAATAGMLLGFDKRYHFLPGFVLSNVFAHAHLAALGWATMLAMGVGYRMLPMVVPSAIPTGPAPLAAVVLVELGTVGLFVTLALQSRWSALFGVVVALGLLTFMSRVGWMVRHRRPAPPEHPRPDHSVWHALVAVGYLGLAMATGIVLLVVEPTEWTLRAALAYGVFGLVGFLGQMIVGIEMRLLPLLAWYWEFAGTDFQGPTVSPHAKPDRWLQGLTFYLWLGGVPAVAGGLLLDATTMLAVGACALLLGTVSATVNAALVLRRAIRVARPSARPRV